MKDSSNKRRDGIILALVAIVGVGGLLLLQLARNRQNITTDERTVVQNQQDNTKTVASDGQSTIQAVPVNLLHINDQPEIDVPFHYELTDFSPGGVYQLDPGDGSPRQTFNNGKLTFTYHKPGSYLINIYTIDGAQEYKILSVPKEVARLTQKVIVNPRKKPVVDE